MKNPFDFFRRPRYTQTAHLENRTAAVPDPESEAIMPPNKKKIRREVSVNGRRVWVSGSTEQEYAENLLRLASRQNGPVEKHPFGPYAMNWFEVFSKPNVSRVTAVCYKSQLDRYILPVLADRNLEDITVADLQKLFNRMGDHMKRESKNKTRIVLNQIFKMAYEDGLIPRNPMASSSLRIKGQPPEVTQPYTVEQMRYLAAHLNDISDPNARAWLAISISLPLRPEEVLGLRWEDLDPDTHTLHIRNTVTHPTRNKPYFQTTTKTDASRRDLYFPPNLLPYLPPRTKPTDFIIGGPEPLSYTRLRTLRKNIAKQTNFPESITPRRFRTTVATDISALTHDLKLVQSMLGHSTPQMTLKHYDKGRTTPTEATTIITEHYNLPKN